MKVIGLVESPYKEKFSIPRQAGLIDIPIKIKILPPYNREEAFHGLNQFSHLWVLFLFNEVIDTEEKLSVRPPRLGGNIKQGVFATRSPYRPNRIGMSAVKIISISKDEIIISGGDFLDKTPVIDIKPYLKKNDCIVDATSSWTDELNDRLFNVEYLNNCDQVLNTLERESICKILSYDPRPRFHEDEKKDYAVKLFNYDIHFKISNDVVSIFLIH